MALSAVSRFRRSSSVVSREVASETLVVPIRGGVGDLDSIFSFNPVGSDIWGLLEGERSIAEMAQWVTDHYEVSAAEAEADILSFVAELLQVGLVSELTAVAPEISRSGGVHASC